MSVAPSIGAGDPLWPEPTEHGVVAVLSYGLAHFAATCSCGWTGRRRYLKAGAQFDAWEHSLHEKCDLSVPLVMPAALRIKA
jgi:hypothetical protein